MMTDEVDDRALGEIDTLSHDVQRMLTHEDFDVDAVDVGDLESLQGVAKFPVRIKCATLAWNTLTEALDAPPE